MRRSLLGAVIVAVGAVASARHLIRTEQPEPSAIGWVDSVVHPDRGAIPQFGRVRVIGWAGARDRRESITTVQIELDNHLIAITRTGDPRPDVGEALRRPDYESSGWHAEFRIGAASVGTHVVTAKACSSDGRCTRLLGKVAFDVSANLPPIGAIASIETPGGKNVVSQSGWVTAEGWAADPDGTLPLQEIDVLIDEVVISRAVPASEAGRTLPIDPHVAHAIRWRSRFNVGGIAPGVHHLSVEVRDAVGGLTRLGSELTLFVEPNGSGPTGAISTVFDAVSNVPNQVVQYGILQVDGWATDPEQGAPVTRVVICVDGTPRTEASLGFDGSRARQISRSDWHAWVDIGSLRSGQHEVSVVAYDSAEKAATLGRRTITVRPGVSQTDRLAAAVQRKGRRFVTESAAAGEYIWTDPDTPVATERNFHRRFRVNNLPPSANLIVFGPDVIDAAVNGHVVAHHEKSPSDLAAGHLVTSEVSRALHVGDNLLAIRTRGGNRLAAGIFGTTIDGSYPSTLVVTGAGWRVHSGPVDDWPSIAVDDSRWTQAYRIGELDAEPSGREGNGDAKLYAWPRYNGISTELRVKDSPALLVRDVRPESARFENLKSLVVPSRLAFRVVQGRQSSQHDPPSIVLDFGRVLSGRLKLVSKTASAVIVRAQLGESVEEALREPFLGRLSLNIPSRGTAYGPKTSFRYALVTFPAGPPSIELGAIVAQELGRPVELRGRFESSDAVLNDIWMTGAYTVSLALQESFWDAPKRDRRSFAGDLHVASRVSRAAFGETQLTLRALVGLADEATKTSTDINTIPGYNAFWILSLADLYEYTQDLSILKAASNGTKYVVDHMLHWLDADGTFSNERHKWLFVDWSPGLDRDSIESRKATQLQYCYALLQSVPILRLQGEAELADRAATAGRRAVESVQSHFLDTHTRTFGKEWQPNAFAVFSGLFGAAIESSIRDRILLQPPTAPISPYYLYYGLEALSRLGEHARALNMVRQRWGAMLEQGATTFWEVFDPSWPTVDFHRSLRVNSSGYFVSLAHAWSSGPTAWLTQRILGIRTGDAGWKEATIEPFLGDLRWARGQCPTPYGDIKVEYHREPNFSAVIDLPPGVSAHVALPKPEARSIALVDGRQEARPITRNGRAQIVLSTAGHHRIEIRSIE